MGGKAPEMMILNDIREFVRFSGCTPMNDMISRVWEWETNLEHLGERMAVKNQIVVGQTKRPKN